MRGIYSIFSDRASSTSLAGFSIARVNKSDFISAIKNKKAPLFNKYYNPITSIPPASPGDFFTEPGIGGNSTFIYSAAPNYIATPQVHYDGALKEFIMVYPQNQNSVWISTAQNLFNWSPPNFCIWRMRLTLQSKCFMPLPLARGLIQHSSVCAFMFTLSLAKYLRVRMCGQRMAMARLCAKR